VNAPRTNARTRRSMPGAAGYPVLVIDDHELFSTSLTIALCNEGFDAQTIQVASIPTFLAGGEPRAAGLVVLDLDLGQDADGRWVNGADLVEGLRA
jgi:ActR/RegA family two-component response regulator